MAIQETVEEGYSTNQHVVDNKLDSSTARQKNYYNMATKPDQDDDLDAQDEDPYSSFESQEVTKRENDVADQNEKNNSNSIQEAADQNG